ncbi:hypothetical protein C8F01DRAFT_1104913 [Mycena amicta]|nr:hypothetical protein C8F01DRAFT_1104913 [Mycena amicta]
MNAQQQQTRPLQRFEWSEPGPFVDLHNDLWPAPGRTTEFSQRVKFLAPDDQWLVSSPEATAMEVDAPASEGEDGEGMSNKASEGESQGSHNSADLNEDPVEIGFIDLKAYPSLVILDFEVLVKERRDHAVLIVRDDYDCFLHHARARVEKAERASSFGPISTAFFVTGQPGIGKSYGCFYLLFRLLAMGQSVFFIHSQTETVYFSGTGVQENVTGRPSSSHYATTDAIRKSWVLINVDGKEEWDCPEIYQVAHCIVWTSSPRDTRMREFCKRFKAEEWYMRTWSTKEIAAATQLFGMSPDEVLRRMETGGPVARALFAAAPKPSTEKLADTIVQALAQNIFDYSHIGSTGTPPMDRILTIDPLVVVDSSGRARLQRTDYSIQEQLAATLNISATRTLAGRAIEGLMHRKLERGMTVPEVFGKECVVAKTFMLRGRADAFDLEIGLTDVARQSPIYLRPRAQNFSAVDGIFVAKDTLGLIQTSLGDSHSRDFGIILKIISRLKDGANIDVKNDWKLFYCLIGTSKDRVGKLVAEAVTTHAKLKELNKEGLGQQLAIPPTKVARDRLHKLSIVGFTFHPKEGFKSVAA